MNTKQLIEHICEKITFNASLRSNRSINNKFTFEIHHLKDEYSDNPNRGIVRFIIVNIKGISSEIIWKREFCYNLSEKYTTKEKAEEFYLQIFLEDLVSAGIMFGYNSLQELKKIK